MIAFCHNRANEISLRLILHNGASYLLRVRRVVEGRLEHAERRGVVCPGWKHEPNAAGKLKALLSEASLAGQCYAFLGLYVLHDAAYQENFARYKSSDARVKTVGGCMITEQPVSSVVSNITAGRYDTMLNAPIH